MSERVERRLFELLGRPEESPYGNPIPGLEAFGGTAVTDFGAGLRNLEAELDDGVNGALTVQRLAETIQVDPVLLGQLSDGGIRPGARITAERQGEYAIVRVQGIEGALELPPEVSAHLFVSRG